MVQPLISVVTKRKKLSSNLAKRKRDQGRLGPGNILQLGYYDEYDKGKVATFGLLLSGLTNHGLFTGSSVIPTAKRSDPENISQSVETCAIHEGQEILAFYAQ